MRMFQVSEDDLAALEHILPDLMGVMGSEFAKEKPASNRLRSQWRRVQQIMQNVRWDYGPPQDVVIIPAGDPALPPPE